MIEFQIKSSFQSFLRLAHHFSNSEMGLLISGDQPEEKASFLFLFPTDKIVVASSQEDPWQILKENITVNSTLKPPSWFGYLSYEMASSSDIDVQKKLPQSPIPLAYFLKPSVICKYENGFIKVTYLAYKICEKLSDKIGRLIFSNPVLLKGFIRSLEEIPSFPIKGTLLNESDSKESYIDKIKQIKELIQAGDIYQVCLSRSILVKTNTSGFDLFYKLFQENPTPYSSYLNLKDFEIISASPEQFLQKSKDVLSTKPIKGTIQRGSTSFDDHLLEKTLLTSTKEDAELSMICDLMRNDLGKVSEMGSVRCVERKKILKLSNVFHLESTIISRPQKMHPVDLIRSCYPAGSISGCPKIRAEEIINQFENRARHIYCGSIGYFLENGDFNLSVAIRTALLKKGILDIQVGGAITYDSDDQLEYKETAHKGSPFLKIFEEKPQLKI